MSEEEDESANLSYGDDLELDFSHTVVEPDARVEQLLADTPLPTSLGHQKAGSSPGGRSIQPIDKELTNRILSDLRGLAKMDFNELVQGVPCRIAVKIINNDT